MSFLLRTTRNTALRLARAPHKSQLRTASTDKTLNSDIISTITAKEKEITGKDGPVKGGPTAQAQKHVGESLNSQNISDITQGEKKITGKDQPIQGGPTSAVQSMFTKNSSGTSTSRGNANTSTSSASGVLDSATISKITDAEKQLTGSDEPVKGGPTAQAQKHAGEPISSEALSDITAGEKKIAGNRVKGGPTSTAQSELGKSRNWIRC